MFKKLDKKGKIYVILAITFVLLLPGGTLAWLEWSSDINALIFGEGCAPEIVVLGGATINGANLRPTVNKENGLHKDVEANLENLCYNDTATMSLNLELDVFPEGLADSSFVWELYKVETNIVDEEEIEVETFLNNGNFQNKEEGDVIQLVDQQVITGNISKYRLYIYLDGNQENPTSTQHQYFKFNLYGSGRDAIYKENTMKKFNLAHNVSYFLLNNENLTKSKIESIEIKTFNDVPSTATYIDDISSLNDDGVRIYYETNSETELNKVYLASSNGIIKMNTNMQGMFSYLTNVEQLDLTHLDTSSVTSMYGLFMGCTKLSSLDISGWDTSNVTVMNGNGNGMFKNCSSLEQLDLRSLNTSKITEMTNMFSGCTKLAKLDISSFDTSKVTSMIGMFSSCSSLKELDLSHFKTPNVTSMSGMFSGCSKLETLNLSNLSNEKLTIMSGMFSNTTNLKDLNLTNFDTSKVQNMDATFRYCGITSLDLSGFDTSEVKTFLFTFANMSNIKELDLSSFTTPNVTTMLNMFINSSKLEKIIFGNFTNEKVTTMQNMFAGCSSLKDLDLTNFKTPVVTNMDSMFGSCRSLTELDLSSFGTSNVTTMYGMFSWCTSLKKVNLSSFTSDKLSDIGWFFHGSSNIEEIDLSNFDFTRATSYTNLFGIVPAGANISVKDCDQKNWLNTNFSTLTNVHVFDDRVCPSV